MFRHVPNVLTVSRLLLAVIFFVILSLYQYEGRGDPTLLNFAFIVYVVALVTDFLDGYLARRWRVEGAFGRLIDPFVDKILVLGSFAFFAGKNFIIAETVNPGTQMVVRTITGVAPGIVVLLLTRELLVTTLRGVAESGGKNFGAAWSGKIKMTLQSVTILIILGYVNYIDFWQRSGWDSVAQWVRDVFIWLTVAITLLSGLTYIRRASALYRGGVGVS